MATYRVRSTDGNNADDGSTWALAKADLHTATTGALAVASAAGDEIYVSTSHAQTSTGGHITFACQGTVANPTKIIGCDDSSDTPTAEASYGKISVTGTSVSYNINVTGNGYWKNIWFDESSTGASANINLYSISSSYEQIYENCKFTFSTGGSQGMYAGYIASSNDRDGTVILKNCVFKFGHTGQRFNIGNTRLRWNGSYIDSSGTTPTALFSPKNGCGIDAIIENSDLTKITTALVEGYAQTAGRIIFRNCKLAAGVSVITGTIPSAGGLEVILDNCDSGDTHSRSERYTYQGSITADTATYLTAMDGDSASSPVKLSQKMTTLASGASFAFPLVLESSKELYKWNETVGSAITATIEILHDSATNLKDDEVWVEFLYMGTSGYPQGVSVLDKKSDFFGTAADQDAGTGAGNWTKSMTNPNSQKLSCTFTVQEKGYISARVYLAKTNKTIYVHPDIIIS